MLPGESKLSCGPLDPPSSAVADAAEVVERRPDSEGGFIYYVHYAECKPQQRKFGCWHRGSIAGLYVLFCI